MRKKLNKLVAMLTMAGLVCLPMSACQRTPGLEVDAAHWNEVKEYIDVAILIMGHQLAPEQRAVLDALEARLDADANDGDGKVDVVKALVEGGFDVLAGAKLSGMTDEELTNAALAIKGIKLVLNRAGGDTQLPQLNELLDLLYSRVAQELDTRQAPDPDAVVTTFSVSKP